MTVADPGLFRLAESAGVSTRYRDVWGQEREVSEESLRAILEAMGIAAASPSATAASVAELEERPWRTPLPPAVIAEPDSAPRVPLTLAAAAGAIDWRLTREDGTEQHGRASADALERVAERYTQGRRVYRLALTLPVPLPAGYHRLRVSAGGGEANTRLIVAPNRCYLPPALTEDRAWALTAQLYSLRSSENWGIGDFGDLSGLAAEAGRLGAQALGLNPLHALFPEEPRHVSPYSPSSRRFLNPLYIDVTAVPEFAHSTATQALAAAPETATRLAVLREAEFVDYPGVAALKQRAFELLYEAFAAQHLGSGHDGARTERGAAFRQFQREHGAALAAFATFIVLHEEVLRQGGSFSWRDWPARWRNAHSAEVRAFADLQRQRCELHHYLQWEAERQLEHAAAAGRAGGLAIGLYRDLAVGLDANGADAWADPAAMVDAASIGAPPDLYNLRGQNWGLSPINPVALTARGFQPFIDAIGANMRHAGLLRIDHVMALQQLYWVPRGAAPVEGAYVVYPLEALTRITALESHRHRCAVIGEDLGTVPSGFRERMADAGILSYRLLLFEREREGRFLPPERYAELASAAFATHDLATVKGFWQGRDLDWRSKLGLFPDETAARDQEAGRRRDRQLLLAALSEAGVLPAGAAARLLPREDEPIYDFELTEAIYRYLGKCRARLVLVQLEDALAELEQANLPGTIDEHPNWRRKLTLDLDQLLREPRVKELAGLLGRSRRGA